MINILDFIKSLVTPKPQPMVSPLAENQPVYPPVATPMPEPRRLATEQYTTRTGQQVPPPPDAIAKILWDVFPDDATRSAVVAWAENAKSNPNARNINTNGSTDLGIFQNNSNTFQDLLRRRPKQMSEFGANQFEDVSNPLISALVASLTRKDEDWSGQDPWSQWYGWKDKGIDLNQ